MNFNLFMSVLMDQSLEVFWDGFHSLYFFPVQNVKINVLVKKIVLVYFNQIEVQVFTNWCR